MVSGVIARVQEAVDRSLGACEPVQVLEAGCGAFAKLKKAPHWRVTGIDISALQLARNAYLDESILGDIQTYPITEGRYDAVICWWVLEHLREPVLALRNLFRATRYGGVVVLAFPNVLSFKGLVTKLSPHWAHVLVYRTVLGIRDAGREDRAPFRTHLRFAMAPSAVQRLAAQHGFAVVFAEHYEAEYQRRLRSRWLASRTLWRIGEASARIVSGGRVRLSETECIVVLRKEHGAASPL